MNNLYINNFEKDKKNFFSKRCENILRDFHYEKKSSSVFEKLIKRLGKDEKDLLFLYSEELNNETAETEEKIYSSGFLDGIYFAVSQFKE